MIVPDKRYVILSVLVFLVNITLSFAGPPFDTDDAEPVKYRHWEYYISSVNIKQIGVWSGTIPHIEVNYGLAQNLQAHLLLPMNYEYSPHTGLKAG